MRENGGRALRHQPERGQANRCSVVTEGANGWWHAAIAKIASGFLLVVTVHRMDAAPA
ncbi:hypothetical protein [Methylobacterium sp. A54F]